MSGHRARDFVTDTKKVHQDIPLRADCGGAGRRRPLRAAVLIERWMRYTPHVDNASLVR